MKIPIKQAIASLLLTGSVAGANANVCNIAPGNVTCNKGTVNSLISNGIVTVKETIVSGPTMVNGLLNAEEANFFTLEVNGSAKLNQCTVNDTTKIKGSLEASSTKFGNTLEIYSNETRFINSKLSNDLHLGHTDSKKQSVYLDNSEVAGNIIFDDKEGEVFLRGKSKISGKVIGGHTILK